MDPLKAPWRKKVLRVLGTLALIVFVLVALGVASAWRGLGRSATGERLALVQKSPQWKGSHFDSPEPLVNDNWGAISAARHASPHTSPSEPVSTVRPDPRTFATAPASGLRVTWLGHSTTLVEIDGYRVLTDPFWSERVGPVSWAGPTRWYAPLIALGDLPHIDAVVISHDHYDHLDEGTITAIRGWDTVFVVPLGVGAHLEYWGVPKEHIVERDWWDKTTVRGLEIVTTPARHASGRGVLDKDATLWAGYALLGPKNRVYFSGDTGLFSAMKDIGDRLGPFDLTMIEVGQYHRAWPDWHIGPEQAVTAHAWVRGKIMLPIHWALVALAYHTWTEPAERVTAQGTKLGAQLALPKPGQSFEPANAKEIQRWWPSLPFETAEQHPIVSGGLRTR